MAGKFRAKFGVIFNDENSFLIACHQSFKGFDVREIASHSASIWLIRHIEEHRCLIHVRLFLRLIPPTRINRIKPLTTQAMRVKIGYQAPPSFSF